MPCEHEVPEVLAAGPSHRRAADRRREGVEHDLVEDHPGEAAVVEVVSQDAGRGGVGEHLLEQADEGLERLGRLARVLGEQLLGELGDRRRVGRTLAGRLALRRRRADLVVLDQEGAQPVHRVVDAVDGVGEVQRGRPDRLLEERQQELVLAGEVLVEAPQRLTRALDDLLDGEVLVLRRAHELEGGVEESLHPLLGPSAGRVERPGDGEVAPAAAVAGRLLWGHRAKPIALPRRERDSRRRGHGAATVGFRRLQTASDGRLDDDVHAGRPAVGHPRLAPAPPPGTRR